MKKKILVLDAFTNGHEAALVFIERQGWTEADCEIVFCGTHLNVLKRLTEGRAYAVVPISNSIIGPVKEVTGCLRKFRKTGYNLKEQDRLILEIKHSLLAPAHITCAEELEGVMSHEEALKQCGKFIGTLGISEDERIKCNSTGDAARKVSGFGPDVRIGAIASTAAALEYGLTVLSEDIQDVANNTTTFILLQNEATIKQVVVGIIGIKGQFGQMLEGFFKQLGCKVIGSDVKNPTGLSNELVVRQSKVVIFSVPIHDTPAVIRSVLPEIKKTHLLMDVTSVKQPSVEAMLGSTAQVVGLHPMFRPEVPFDGQTVVVCPARLTLRKWKTWVVNVLAATRAHIKWSTASEHDGYMTTVQVIPHIGNLTSALLLTETGVSASESLEFTSPFYRVMFSLMGRLVSQSPSLYTSIVMENPETLTALKRRIAIERRLVKMIQNKDRASFEKLFGKANAHFGQDVTKEANELFMRILGVLSTLYGKDSVMLEFNKAHNRPGLLGRITKVFSDRQINLAGINYVAFDADRLQFTLCFEQSRNSNEVLHALAEIENWSDCKVRILK